MVHLQRYPLAYESLVRYWHDYRPDDVVACPSEMGWMLPVATTFLYAFAHGVTVVLYDPEGGRFDPERWFALFQKYRITNFTAPPTIYRMLMASAEAAEPVRPVELAARSQRRGAAACRYAGGHATFLRPQRCWMASA